jgi:hypothetical protein
MTETQRAAIVKLASDACAYGVRIAREVAHGHPEPSDAEIAAEIAALVSVCLQSFGLRLVPNAKDPQN